MDKRRLELKAELSRRGWHYRDLASKLRELGIDADSFDIARIVAGRWEPPEVVRQACSRILNRQAFELFRGGRAA